MNYPTVSENVDHGAAMQPLTDFSNHSIQAQFVENVGQSAATPT